MSKDKQLLVRYEDICNHTEETLQTIFEFCGVSTDLRKLNRDPAQQHIVGNSMRLRPLDEIKLDERWKNELDQMQIDSIRKIAGNLNQLYGYKVKE